MVSSLIINSRTIISRSMFYMVFQTFAFFSHEHFLIAFLAHCRKISQRLCFDFVIESYLLFKLWGQYCPYLLHAKMYELNMKNDKLVLEIDIRSGKKMEFYGSRVERWGITKKKKKTLSRNLMIRKRKVASTNPKMNLLGHIKELLIHSKKLG